MSSEHLFPTTVAGSLPKPHWLAEPEKLWAAWRHEDDALQSAQEDAALMWLKVQEDAERIMACTNCGLAPLPEAVAKGKLHALGQGAALMRSRLA